MQTAMQHNVEGIDAVCGGAMACATCHVYVDSAWFPKIPRPDSTETEMLGFVAAEQRATSRLSCQITMTEALDGLIVTMPDTQVTI